VARWIRARNSLDAHQSAPTWTAAPRKTPSRRAHDR
jgi:hypothetical protein